MTALSKGEGLESSASTIAMLETLHRMAKSDASKSLKRPFQTFDILSDEGIRSGVKEYSSWPTLPQIFVKGEFIGGNDIVTELFESGELKQIVEAL